MTIAQASNRVEKNNDENKVALEGSVRFPERFIVDARPLADNKGEKVNKPDEVTVKLVMRNPDEEVGGSACYFIHGLAAQAMAATLNGAKFTPEFAQALDQATHGFPVRIMPTKDGKGWNVWAQERLNAGPNGPRFSGRKGGTTEGRLKGALNFSAKYISNIKLFEVEEGDAVTVMIMTRNPDEEVGGSTAYFVHGPAAEAVVTTMNGEKFTPEFAEVISQATHGFPVEFTLTKDEKGWNIWPQDQLTAGPNGPKFPRRKK